MSLYVIAIIIGTRPEAVKLAPVIAELKSKPDLFKVLVISTGQHREMLDQVLTVFNIKPDLDLNLMKPGQSLAELTGRMVPAMDRVFDDVRPDMLLVQGDTTTVFAAGLAAFYRGIPVGHVEAGLRSHDLRNPFPEEANRRMVSVTTDLHFAPTSQARRELLNEGFAADRIIVTGNTVVDALERIIASAGSSLPAEVESALEGRRLILITSHRRESWGERLERICLAVREVVREHPDVLAVYPVHLNPQVRATVEPLLGGVDRVMLLQPQPYIEFVGLMRRADLILTDSGGIQEEAPTFGTPVLILRKVTERPEAAQQGQALLVDADPPAIIEASRKILADRLIRERIRHLGNPFGDGRAAQRIGMVLERYFTGLDPLPESEQFHFVNQEAS